MNTIERIKRLSYEEQQLLAEHLYRTETVDRSKLPDRPTCLKAIVKTNSGAAFSDQALRQFLRGSLPEHLIPLRIERVDSFPVTPNGKIDRKALETKSHNVDLRPKHTDAAAELDVPNKTEQLLEIWRRILGRHDIGISDNFFDLGGHSLTAAQLIAEVQAEYGVKLSIADLFKTPTVSEFSELLDIEPSKKQRKSLVSLKDGTKGNALFCVHGYKGDVYVFLPIAKAFGNDRPIYGLQALGLDGQKPFQSSFEEMAKLYVSEVFEAQPDGPYHLLGYSIGGWIAFEMAQEIKRRGREVGSLGLLDTQAAPAMPSIYKLPHTLKYAYKLNRPRIGAFRAMSGKEKMAYLKDRLKFLRVYFFGGEIPASIRKEFEKESSRLKNRDYFAKIGNRYLPSVYHGDADLIVSEDTRIYHTWFWKHLIKGKLRIHKTRGDHYKAISEDNASYFANLFEEILQSAESESDNR